MSKILIIHALSQTAIQGAEQYFPQARVGNLKDQAKIDAKVAEHNAKCLDEAATHSLLGQPTKIELCVVNIPDGDSLTFTDPQVGTTEVFGADKLAKLATFLGQLEDVKLILGPHPTTHTRQIQNCLIRQRLPVPKCFDRRVERLNVFQQLSTVAEGEYPANLKPLGLPEQGAIEDTLQVGRLLGVI